MAEHKLAYGKEIIERLYNLGKILNYHCEKEYSVDKKNESAVDIAWLFEAEQKYPLFIFEIESKTTNSIPSNPLKIFGEPNQKFEKPLFLFHLLLTGGQQSGKIPQLERTYGTYNYRIYRFSLKEETTLIKDILSQHRRLTNKLKISEFLIEIIAIWKEINIDSVVLHIEELEFEKNNGIILPSYAKLSKVIPKMKGHFIRRLKQKAEAPNGLFGFESYETYLGTEWSIPIHLGLLAAFANDGQEQEYFNDFKNWQEKSYYLKQIGASYGLSRDYDLFIIGMAGSVLSLTALLFYKVPEATSYLCGELLEIVQKSERFESGNLNNCSWLLHLSSKLEKGNEYFEFVKEIINENGGIPIMIYSKPRINFIEVLEGEEIIESFGKFVLIPSWDEFIKIKKKSKLQPEILFNLALNYLTDNKENWNPIVEELL